VTVPGTQPIADWLAKIDLEQYAPAFANNDIDVSVLRHLTDADLEKIGVSLGHRRKMLAAISQLSDAPQSPHEPAGRPEPKQDSAERRQLTVMFTDLVGSSALSTRLDPEDLRAVIGAYHKCVAETVARFNGFVAKYMGDGVLVYFGYPQAHEDDGCRCGRRLRVSIVTCGRPIQGGVNSGRKVRIISTRSVGTRSTRRSRDSRVVGSLQCTSSHTISTG
jgi:class 3 adenylate cyclase